MRSDLLRCVSLGFGPGVAICERPCLQGISISCDSLKSIWLDSDSKNRDLFIADLRDRQNRKRFVTVRLLGFRKKESRFVNEIFEKPATFRPIV